MSNVNLCDCTKFKLNSIVWFTIYSHCYVRGSWTIAAFIYDVNLDVARKLRCRVTSYYLMFINPQQEYWAWPPLTRIPLPKMSFHRSQLYHPMLTPSETGSKRSATKTVDPVHSKLSWSSRNFWNSAWDLLSTLTILKLSWRLLDDRTESVRSSRSIAKGFRK